MKPAVRLIVLSTVVAGVCFAQPPGPRPGGGPGPMPGTLPPPPGPGRGGIVEKLLDGNWDSREGKYDFSDVDLDDKGEIATFFFERTKKIGRRFRPGEDRDARRERFREGDEVKCKGTGIYDRDAKLVTAQEICPSHFHGLNVLANLVLKLEIPMGFRGGSFELSGKRIEQFVAVTPRGDIQIGERSEREETLKKEKDREGGPIWRRGGLGRPGLPGPGPGPGTLPPPRKP